MSAYDLGIDLGTTYTAAATARGARVEIVGLGNRAASIPSVILLRDDETILTGESANRRAATEPGRVAREFKRRIGDPTPLLLGGSPYSAEALTAKLLRWVVDRVAELEGGPAGRLAVTHPANWGPYKQDLLAQAIRMADLPGAVTLTEPQAAAISYAANERVEPGAIVAVYDLGGGTFDAAVLRKTVEGFEILGDPEGIERLGGIDLDEAVMAHVRRNLGDVFDGLDLDDETILSSLARLRRECVDAKEALSSDTEVAIPVLLPSLQTEVRLTRGEFEQLVRPTLSDTVAALRRALTSAGVQPDDVATVLLVGGSSRIPLVAELVSDAFGRPIAVDAHPKHAVALGAANAAAIEASHAGAPTADPEMAGAVAVAARATETAPLATAAAATPAAADPSADAAPTSVSDPTSETASDTLADQNATTPMQPVAVPAAAPRSDHAAASSAPPSTPVPPAAPPPSGGRSKLPLLGGVGVLVVALAVAAVVWLTGGDDDPTLATDAVEEAVGSAPVEEPEPEAPEAPAEPEPTPEPTPEPADEPPADETPEVPPDRDFVTIDEIEIDGQDYVVEFTTYRFDAQVPGQHVHFFFDTVPPEEAGVPGSGPWFLYGDPSPFTGYGVGDRPAGAQQLCVLVANPDHSVQPDSGTCADLP